MKFDSFKVSLTQTRALRQPEYTRNLCAVFRLAGDSPDPDRLARAVSLLARHCHPLRSLVVHGEDGPRYLTYDTPLAGLDFMKLDASDTAGAVLAIETLCTRPLRLDAGAPWSMTLLTRGADSFLVFACHPALLDGFSLTPLFEALSEAYRTGELTGELGLGQPAILEAEQASLETNRWREALAFWVQELGDSRFGWLPARLERANDTPVLSVPLGLRLSQSLRDQAGQLGLRTEFMLQACLHVLLQALSHRSVVITAHHERAQSRASGSIGYDERIRFVRTEFNDDMTLRQFLQHAAMRRAMAEYHANIPAGDVMDELRRLNPDNERPTTVLCEPDTLPHHALTLGASRGVLLANYSRRPLSQDVALYLRMDDEIVIDAMVNHPHLAGGLAMALDHFVALLERLPQLLDTPVGQMDFDSPALAARREAWSRGAPLRVPALDVLARFDEVVHGFPDQPAVSGPDARFTYAELSRAAARVREQVTPLLTGAGAHPLVGICVSRGARFVPLVLGVMAADAGYVPLDPLMPEERLRYMAGDAQLAAVIVDEHTEARVRSVFACPILRADTSPGQPSTDIPALFRHADATRTAYVIYTSGTTGHPKGVAIERGMLAHLMAALDACYACGPGTRWMQFASVNFDASVLEIFNPLTHGGQLVVAPDTVRSDPPAMFDFLAQQEITHAFLPPAVLRLLPRRPLPALNTILCGGEAGDDETVRFWSSVVRLSNIYGPTETTVLATEKTFSSDQPANLLGRPLPGYAIHLLDARGRGAPLGGIGEICIGGPAVARGYLRRPDLTGQKFMADPYAGDARSERLYRSGDLGRYLPNGEIEFLGRGDQQVKVRGYRIELAEIEQHIAAQPEVTTVCVGTYLHQGSLALVAWFSARGLTATELRRRLEARVPAYMVPAFFVPMDAWALTLNGKIDRTRLPAPSAGSPQAPAHRFGTLEKQVQAAWAATLGLDPDSIGMDSHFFEAGGHSLLGTLACAQLGAALGTPVKPALLLAHPRFSDFCVSLEETLGDDDSLPPFNARDDAQNGVRLMSGIARAIADRARFDPADNSYHIVVRMDFSREVNPLRLHAALSQLTARDPLFRASIRVIDGEHRLVPDTAQTPSALMQSATPGETRALVDAWAVAPLSPVTAPCWRARLMLDPHSGVSTIVFAIHHAMFDGWSLKLLLDELAAHYEGRLTASRTLNWFDFNAWLHDARSSPAYATAQRYWRQKLDAVALRVDLPYDASPRRPNHNRALAIDVSPLRTQALRAIAKARGTTLSPVLFALHLLWLWRISGQTGIASGYPQAGRDVPGSESIYGMLVSMAVLSVQIDSRQPFGDFVTAVHTQMLADRDHLLATPHEAQVPDVGALNTLFSLQSGIDLRTPIGEGFVTAEEMPSKTSKADLAAIFYLNAQGGIDGRIEYDSSRLSERLAESFRDVLMALLDAAAATPDALTGELAYMQAEQAARVDASSRGPTLDHDATSIPARFAAVADRFGDLVALRCGDQSLTYRALDELSNRIANGLRQHVSAGACVGLAMSKGTRIVAAILGALRAGCAYVPLDPSYPAERLQHFAANCDLTVCIVDAPGREGLNAAGLDALVCVDCDTLANHTPQSLPMVPADALAYVIHTSGSTGKPKGVLIEHHSVVRMIAGAADALGYRDGAVSTLVASTNFDASVLEMFLPLLNGGTLVVVPETVRTDPEQLHRLLEREAVTHCILAPVMLQALPRRPVPGLQMLGFGGDTLDETAARWWAAHTSLFTLYGPTETTVMATAGRIDANGPVRVIGKPLPGYDVYVLNTQGQPVPPGAVGELCIGGANLARGYRNESVLTLRRFTTNRFSSVPYARLYRTGDLGRHLADGTIEYFGRNDAQIKLRGFRIELGEIENSLAVVAGVEHVACAVVGEGERRYIAAYYVVRDGALIDEAVLRAHVAATLPDYMAPTRYVALKALPLSGSGKIDRKALPVPSTRDDGELPHEGLESQIAAIWCELLDVPAVYRDDDFFRLGGNSILAMQMHARVHASTGLDFSLPAFYRAPTLAALAGAHDTDDIGRAIADAAAPITMTGPMPPPWNGTAIRTVILTGASGFVGIHLLDELVRKGCRVLSLQRADHPEAGIDRLREAARTADLAIDWTKVDVVCADLAQIRLGVSDTDWRRLATEGDAILHCGAHVHHLHGYGSLKAANVESTESLLHLASTDRMKPVCFLSTMSVPMALEGVACVEERITGAPPASSNGYLLGKWVSEQRVAGFSRQYGLPATIARVGNVTGHSVSGYSNYRHNHFWLFNKGCIQLGAYPQTGQSVEMTPVDLLARAIVALTLNPRHGLDVANLQNPAPLTQRDWFDALSGEGLRAVPEPAYTWQRRLDSLDDSNALALLRDFYRGDLTVHEPPVEQIGTIARLDALDVDLNIDYARLILIYAAFLRQEQFFNDERTDVTSDLA